MTIQHALATVEELIPAVIGGTFGFLAIVGIRELLKETKVAFGKKANA